MSEKPCKKTIEELIHDDSFILWVLFPTEDTEKKWIAYQRFYPEEKENVEKAQERVRLLRLVSGDKLTAVERNTLKKRIEQAAIRHRQWHFSGSRFLQYAAVACILLVGIVGTWYLHREEALVADDELCLIDTVWQGEQREVELQRSSRKMEIANNATIAVNEKGRITVLNEDTAQASGGGALLVQDARNHSAKASDPLILTVPKGRRSSLLLPDGTKIWVNAGSILQFPEQFDSDKREIQLDGEAYLEVAKDARRPFYVKTRQMNVRVLGTSFDVSAYPGDKSQYVALKEGSVSVETDNGLMKTIRPNELLVVEEGRMSVNQVNIYNYISWVDGVLQFHGETLGTVLRSLSRYYRLQFKCVSGIDSLKCSGKLVLFDNPDDVLKTLQQTLSISCQREGNVVEIKSNHPNK